MWTIHTTISSLKQQNMSNKPADHNSRFKRNATTANKRRCARKIVLLGSKEAGKTALIKRFLGEGFSGTYTPSLEEHHKHNYEYRGYNLNLDIVDMCSPFTFPVMRDLNIRSAHVLFLVYEIGNQTSVDELNRTIEIVQEKRPNMDVAVVLVGAKYDLYPQPVSVEEYQLTDDLFRLLPNVNGGHVLTSAKLSIGVKDAFEKGLQYVVGNLPHSCSLNDCRHDVRTKKNGDGGGGDNGCCVLL